MSTRGNKSNNPSGKRGGIRKAVGTPTPTRSAASVSKVQFEAIQRGNTANNLNVSSDGDRNMDELATFSYEDVFDITSVTPASKPKRAETGVGESAGGVADKSNGNRRPERQVRRGEGDAAAATRGAVARNGSRYHATVEEADSGLAGRRRQRQRTESAPFTTKTRNTVKKATGGDETRRKSAIVTASRARPTTTTTSGAPTTPRSNDDDSNKNNKNNKNKNNDDNNSNITTANNDDVDGNSNGDSNGDSNGGNSCSSNNNSNNDSVPDIKGKNKSTSQQLAAAVAAVASAAAAKPNSEPVINSGSSTESEDNIQTMASPSPAIARRRTTPRRTPQATSGTRQLADSRGCGEGHGGGGSSRDGNSALVPKQAGTPARRPNGDTTVSAGGGGGAAAGRPGQAASGGEKRKRDVEDDRGREGVATRESKRGVRRAGGGGSRGRSSARKVPPYPLNTTYTPSGKASTLKEVYQEAVSAEIQALIRERGKDPACTMHVRACVDTAKALNRALNEGMTSDLEPTPPGLLQKIRKIVQEEEAKIAALKDEQRLWDLEEKRLLEQAESNRRAQANDAEASPEHPGPHHHQPSLDNDIDDTSSDHSEGIGTARRTSDLLLEATEDMILKAGAIARGLREMGAGYAEAQEVKDRLVREFRKHALKNYPNVDNPKANIAAMLS